MWKFPFKNLVFSTLFSVFLIPHLALAGSTYDTAINAGNLYINSVSNFFSPIGKNLANISDKVGMFFSPLASRSIEIYQEIGSTIFPSMDGVAQVSDALGDAGAKTLGIIERDVTAPGSAVLESANHIIALTGDSWGNGIYTISQASSKASSHTSNNIAGLGGVWGSVIDKISNALVPLFQTASSSLPPNPKSASSTTPPNLPLSLRGGAGASSSGGGVVNPTTIVRTTIERLITTPGLTREELDASLAELRAEIAAINANTQTFTNGQANHNYDSVSRSTSDTFASFASGGAFTDPSITGGSITGATIATPTISGATSDGLTITPTTPSDTTDLLYNTAESLYWNGNLVAGATVGNWTANSGNAFRLTGNVGVGTSTPFARLSITGNGTGVGSAFVIADSSNAQKFSVLDNGQVNVGGSIIPAAGATYNLGSQSNQFNSVFTSYGFLLPGVAMVSGANNETGILRISPDYAGVEDTQAGIWLGKATQGDAPLLLKPTGSNDLQIKSESGLVRMVVGSNGNVGIGTTSPSRTFAVQGNGLFSGNLDVANLVATGTANFYADTTVHSRNLVVDNYDISDLLLTGRGFGDVGFGITVHGGGQITHLGNSTNHPMDFETNGLERMRITADGNIGIGTTSPSALLSVNAPAGSSSFAVGSSTATSFMIDKTGRVAIGTASPPSTSKLYVVGNSTDDNYSGTLTVIDSSQSRSVSIGNTGITASSILYLDGAATYIGSRGLGSPVQVGVNSQYGFGGVALEVNNFSNGGIAPQISLSNAYATLNTGNSMLFRTGGTGGSTTTASVSSSLTGVTASVHNGDLRFNVLNAGSTTEALRIASSGNVGIGSTNPSAAKLVVGNNNTTIGIQAGSNTTFGDNLPNLKVMGYDGTGNRLGGGGIELGDGTGDSVNMFIGRSSANDFYIKTTGQNTHDLYLTPKRNLIVDSGNVGIGTTSPSALLSLNAPAGSPSFAIGSSTATSFFVDKLGNVGIGTAAPDAHLTITGADASQNYLSFYNNTYPGREMTINSTGGAWNLVTNPWALTLNTGSNSLTLQGAVQVYYGAMTFSTNGGGSNAFGINNTSADLVQLSSSNGALWHPGGFNIMSLNTNSGLVGIGTTSPYARLALNSFNGGIAPQFVVASSTGAGATSTDFIIASNGNVGVGTTSPGAKFAVESDNLGGSYVTGLLLANNTITTTGSRTQLPPMLTMHGNIWSVRGSGDNATVDWNFKAGGFTNSSVDNYAIPTLTIQGTTNSAQGGTVNSNALYLGPIYARGDSTMTILAPDTPSFADIFLKGNYGSIGFMVSTEVQRLPKASITYVDTGLGWNRGDLYFMQNSATGSNNLSLSDVRMDLTNAGNLGIGTTSPFAQLAVNPVAGQASNQFVVGSSTATNFIVKNDGSVGIGTAVPSNKLTVSGSADFTGSVGIGNSSPPFALTVGGLGSAITNLFGAGNFNNVTKAVFSGVTVGGGGGQDYTQIAVQGTNAQGISFNSALGAITASLSQSSGAVALANNVNAGTIGLYTLTSGGASNVFFMNSTGSVGVGSSSPFATLAVNPTAGSSTNQFVVGSSTATNFIIKNDGSVGIGTAAPAYKLDVNGTISSTQFCVNSCLTIFKNVNSGGDFAYVGGNHGIFFGDQGGGVAMTLYTGYSGAQKYLYIDGNEGVSTSSPFATLAVNPVAGAASNQFVVGSSTATNFIINNSGFIGVGQTNPAYKFDVMGDIRLVASTTATSGTRSINSPSLILRGNQYNDRGSASFDAQAIFKVTPGIVFDNWVNPVLSISTNSSNGGSSGITIGDIADLGDSKLQLNASTLGTYSDIMIQGGNQTGAGIGFSASGQAGRRAKAAIGFVGDGGAYDTGSLVFLQNNVHASANYVTNSNIVMTLTAAGNLGIGTTSPWRTLSVAGSVATPALVNDSTGYYVCVNSTTGQMATSTSACGASSIRFKENVQDISYGLSDLEKLRAVSFDWKKSFMPNGTHQIGFIAEDVANVIPEIVTYDADGHVMNLDYPKLTPVIVKSIQELDLNLNSIISNASSTPASTSFASSFWTSVTDHISAWLASAGNGIHDFFTNTSHQKTLCVGDTGSETCITKTQLDSLLQNAGQTVTTTTTSSGGGSTGTSTDSGSGGTSTTTSSGGGADTQSGSGGSSTDSQGSTSGGDVTTPPADTPPPSDSPAQ